MIHLEIEHGIPIPEPGTRRGHDPYPHGLPIRFEVRYPDPGAMQPGDSYFVPGLPKVIRNSIEHRARRNFKHVARAYYGPEWGVRIWRVE